MQPYVLGFIFFTVRVYTQTRALPSLARQEMAENGGGGQLTVKARFNFKQNNEDELSFSKGDMIVVTRQEEGGWWEGSLNGKTGWFPSNYVREIKPCGELGQGRCSIDPLLALRWKEVLCVRWRDSSTHTCCLYASEKPVSPKGTQLTKNYYSVVS